MKATKLDEVALWLAAGGRDKGRLHLERLDLTIQVTNRDPYG
jgi:hypothetical protein